MLKLLFQIKKLKKYMKNENGFMVIFDHEGLKNEIGDRDYEQVVNFISKLNQSL